MPKADHFENPTSHVRGERMRQKVLSATLSELAEHGYAALSVDLIARRAFVHKTTIYRRWGGLESLVAEALADHIAEEVPIPDTGSIEGDLRELARGLARFLQGEIGEGLVAVMLSDATRHPEIAGVRDRVFRDRFHRASAVVERAIGRGELPESTKSELLVKTLIAPIYFDVLYVGEKPTIETADRAARVALCAARGGAL